MITFNKYFLKHRNVSTITVTNCKNLKIVFCTMGASIFECYIGERKVTYAPRYLVDFLLNPTFFGKTAGRTAGRIRDGIVTINNRKYKLAKSKIHSLHGGFGFSFKNYAYSCQEDDEFYYVKFHMISNDMENGYPGKMVNDVIYKVYKNEDKFELEFKAISNKDTICNLTNHTYWNLNGEGTKIVDHLVYINANTYVRTDYSLLKEDILPVDKVFDFTKPKLLGEEIEDKRMQEIALGYDNDWILNANDLDTVAASFESKNKDLKLNIYTTNPVCHLYTGNHFPDGEKYGAVAIELQKRIFDVEEGAVNLKANEKYDEKTIYEFVYKNA